MKNSVVPSKRSTNDCVIKHRQNITSFVWLVFLTILCIAFDVLYHIKKPFILKTKTCIDILAYRFYVKGG